MNKYFWEGFRRGWFIGVIVGIALGILWVIYEHYNR